MKIFLTLFLSAALTSIGLMAQGGPPPHAGPRNHTTGIAVSDDLAALDQFLTMDDAQLDQLQQAITRVRSMTPAERASLRTRIADYRRLPVEQREKVRAGWGWLNEADRNDWPSMMRSLPEAERSAIQTEIQSLSPDQRATRKNTLLKAWRASERKTDH